MSERILTPVGRIVEGSVSRSSTTDTKGNPRVDRSGNPKTQYYFALAIPKTSPEWPAILAAMTAEAKNGFPALFPNGQCILPSFAWKITDGDSQVPNQNMTKPCDKEGHPGHWVLRFTSGFAIPCYNENGEVISAETVKTGYYARVNFSVVANGDKQKPGLFVNPNGVQMVAYGEEITSRASFGEMFGGAPIPAALPAGASVIPLAPLTEAPGFATPAPVQPNYAFAAGPATAPVAPPPAPAPAAPVKVVYNGVQYERDFLLSSGWTVAQVDALPKA